MVLLVIGIAKTSRTQSLVSAEVCQVCIQCQLHRSSSITDLTFLVLLLLAANGAYSIGIVYTIVTT